MMQKGLVQKSLLGLAILMIVALVTFLKTGKKFGLETRKKDGILLEMIANISTGLDRLDAEIDEVSVQTELARNRLGQLAALHRENLAICAALLQKKIKKADAERQKGSVVDPT